MTVNERKQLKRRLARERKQLAERKAIKEANKKKARALHDMRNAQEHFKAQKRKTSYELEEAKNIVYVDDKEQRIIEETIDKDIAEFLYLEGILSNIRIENEFLRKYIPDLYVLMLISLNKIIRAIRNKTDALHELCDRARYTQLVHGGLKVTVVPNSFGVCVYIIVPSTHEKFKTCNEHFTCYTFDKVLEDGSKKFGWDFGYPYAMLMYKIKKIIGVPTSMLIFTINEIIEIMGIEPLRSYEICDKISSLCIITMKDVNELIVEQLSLLLSAPCNKC